MEEDIVNAQSSPVLIVVSILTDQAWEHLPYSELKPNQQQNQARKLSERYCQGVYE